MTSQANRDDMIRDRAYSIWIEQGRPDGMADEHWHKAADAIDAEGAAVAPLVDLGDEPVPPETAPLLVTPNR